VPWLPAEGDALYVAGVDIGSASSKALILKRDRVLAHALMPTGAESAASAERVMESALRQAGLGLHDMSYIISTGYGRIIVPFADEEVTELSCHARGAHRLFAGARTVLDMGGQDCKAIRCDERGRLGDFAMNDKCAAGTGRFLELMAAVLQIPLEQIGPLSLEATGQVRISNTCAVFGKSEVAALVRQGRDRRDILAGLHEAIAARVYTLLRKVGVEPDFVIAGGIGKNVGVVRRLEARAGLPALVPPEPQIVGALGAALFAADRVAEGAGRRQRQPIV
jgi:predicted CoA-substrate-specific enzyme activase